MARPLRIEYEHAFYHVISRAARGEAVFTSTHDKLKFLDKCAETVEKFKLRLHAYVIMNNHYHLLLETPGANLSKAMHHLNTSYANWFRCKYQTRGEVFQGRYRAILVEKDSYLQILSAYIHLNPVRAGMVQEPEAYRFSSFPAYCGKVRVPPFLYTRNLVGLFNGDAEYYQRYVKSFPAAGGCVRHEEIYGSASLLGSKGFIRQAYEKANAAVHWPDDREQPEAREVARVEVDDVLECLLVDMRIPEEDLWSPRRGNVNRKLLVYGLKRFTDSGLKEIGRMLQMDYAAVSAMYRRFSADMTARKDWRKMGHDLAEHIAKRRLRKG